MSTPETREALVSRDEAIANRLQAIVDRIVITARVDDLIGTAEAAARRPIRDALQDVIAILRGTAPEPHVWPLPAEQDERQVVRPLTEDRRGSHRNTYTGVVARVRNDVPLVDTSGPDLDGERLQEVGHLSTARDGQGSHDDLAVVRPVVAHPLRMPDEGSPVSSSEDTPAREQQWAVRHPEVRLSVHRSPHSVLYTASKLPGGVIVTRASDQDEWRDEKDCLCGDSKPADRHFEACPGEVPAGGEPA